MLRVVVVALWVCAAAAAAAPLTLHTLPLCESSGGPSETSPLLPPPAPGTTREFPLFTSLGPHAAPFVYLSGPDPLNTASELYVSLLWFNNATDGLVSPTAADVASVVVPPLKLADSVLFLPVIVPLGSSSVLVLYRNGPDSAPLALTVTFTFTLDPLGPTTPPLLVQTVVGPPLRVLPLPTLATSGGPGPSFFGAVGDGVATSSSSALLVVTTQIDGDTSALDNYFVEVGLDPSPAADPGALIALAPPFRVPSPFGWAIRSPYAPYLQLLGKVGRGKTVPVLGSRPVAMMYTFVDVEVGTFDIVLRSTVCDISAVGTVACNSSPTTLQFPDPSRSSMLQLGPNKVVFVVHETTISLRLSAMVCNIVVGTKSLSGCGQRFVLPPDYVTEIFSVVPYSDTVFLIMGINSNVEDGSFVVALEHQTPLGSNILALTNLPGLSYVSAKFSTAQDNFAYGYPVLFPSRNGAWQAGETPSTGVVVGSLSNAPGEFAVLPFSLSFPGPVSVPATVPPVLFGVWETVNFTLPEPSGAASSQSTTFGCVDVPDAFVGFVDLVWDESSSELQVRSQRAGDLVLSVRLDSPRRETLVPLQVLAIPNGLVGPRYANGGLGVTTTSITIDWPEVANHDELFNQDVVYTLYGVGLDGEPLDIPLSLDNATVLASGINMLSYEITGLSPNQHVLVAVHATTQAGVGGEPSEWVDIQTKRECLAPGTFLPESNPVFGACVSCQINDYPVDDDLLAGVGRCVACPINTASPANSAGLADCACVAGYYAPDTEQPFNCERCPSGALCPGGLERPQPRDGYYIYEGEVIVCPRPESCLAPGRCAPGYEGILCVDCADGYFLDVTSNECSPCPPSPGVLLGFVFVAMLVVAIGVLVGVFHLSVFPWEVGTRVAAVRRTRRVPHSLSVSIVFLQVLGVLSSINTKWPSSVSRTMGVFRAVNLDLNLVASECSLSKYETSYALSMLLPLMLVALHVVGLVLGSVLPFARGYLLSRGLSTQGLGSMVVVSLERVVCVLGPVMYIGMAQSTLRYFDCTKFPDSQWYLDVAPGTRCFSSSWWSVFPLAFVAMIVYVIALPAFLGWVIFSKIRGSVTSQPVMARYGSIFLLYRRPLYYYELVMLGKRLILVVVVLFFSSTIVVQLFLLLALFQGYTLLQVKYHPYYRVVYNQMEVRLNTAISFLVLFGLCFYVDQFPNTASRVTFAVLAIAVIVVCLLFLVFAMVSEVRLMVAARNASAGEPAGGDPDPDEAVNEREAVFWAAFEAEFDDINDIDMKLRMLELYQRFAPNPKDLG